jgi:hypothetical protein
VADGGENPNLIDCIVYFSVGEVDELDLFEGIDGLIDEPFDLVDARVSTFPQL